MSCLDALAALVFVPVMVHIEPHNFIDRINQLWLPRTWQCLGESLSHGLALNQSPSLAHQSPSLSQQKTPVDTRGIECPFCHMSHKFRMCKGKLLDFGGGLRTTRVEECPKMSPVLAIFYSLIFGAPKIPEGSILVLGNFDEFWG